MSGRDTVIQRGRSLDAPKDFVTRHDGVLVATSTLDREDLMFMAAEEEAYGNFRTANVLRELSKRKAARGNVRARRQRIPEGTRH